MGDGKKICIHGHFYQPPREDPWMDTIFPEGSAAPAKHWNERICSESYSPLAWARRLDGEGRITELMNCYEWMSFNFGPTLLTWMERQAPDTYARMLEGDAKSLARLGHGNAIAQIYHHIIMPLATHTERRAEIAWALADFEARFKRPAEGMWLSEAAVDTETLDLLAQAGVAFTILAPRQAREVADLNQDNWTAAHEGNLDIRQPYRVELPQGRSIAVYFYNGPLSQAVAFEGVLGHGDRFWSWLSSLSGQGLLALATDGETYGHHFKFGEMALAHALSQARAGVDGVEICNYGAYLAANPPSRRVRIHENSSWSCVHGVERWRSDCGCCAEHKPGWNQRWRGPLRDGLRDLKTHLDTHFVKRGAEVFRDAEDALVHYGRVLCGQDDDAAFERAYFKKGLNPAQRDVAWKLLTMQKWALSSFASCAWFFDDLGRIEPLNALTYALRALGLAQRTGAGDLESVLLAHIGQASSNEPALGSGLDLWNREIRPRRESTESLVAQALLTLWAESGIPEPEGAASISWPGLTVEIRVAQHGEDVPAAQKNTAQSATTQDGPAIELSGTASITWAKESGSDACTWHWERPHCGGPLTGCVQIRRGSNRLFRRQVRPRFLHFLGQAASHRPGLGTEGGGRELGRAMPRGQPRCAPLSKLPRGTNHSNRRTPLGPTVVCPVLAVAAGRGGTSRRLFAFSYGKPGATIQSAACWQKGPEYTSSPYCPLSRSRILPEYAVLSNVRHWRNCHSTCARHKTSFGQSTWTFPRPLQHAKH